MDKELIEQVMEALNDHLVYCYDKSGIKLNRNFLGEVVVLASGIENKLDSMFLGVYELPTEEYKKGRIILYIDAISDYAATIGRDFFDVATKIFFALLHDYMSYSAKGKTNRLKAEAFSTRICRKLLKQNLISQSPPVFYIDYSKREMYYQIKLRQEWIKRWTGLTLEKLNQIFTE